MDGGKDGKRLEGFKLLRCVAPGARQKPLRRATVTTSLRALSYVARGQVKGESGPCNGASKMSRWPPFEIR